MYTNIVFSGGGVRGIAYVGALRQLEKLNLLQNIHNYAGSSVGSLIASLIAIGYTVKEIKQLLTTIDFNKILDDDCGYVRDIFNFLKHYGYASGDYIYKLLGKMIKDKTGNKDYTLEDLYKTGKKLVITATNLNTRSVVFLQAGHINPLYSNIPIRKAVRMSMSIPFVFQPILYNDCFFCDGGVLNNYPITCFDVDDMRVNNDLHHKGKTLGLKLTQHVPEKEEITNLYDYSYSYIETFLAENDRHTIDPDRTILIETDNYPLAKFDLTFIEKQTLIKQGKDAVKHYFK